MLFISEKERFFSFNYFLDWCFSYDCW